MSEDKFKKRRRNGGGGGESGKESSRTEEREGEWGSCLHIAFEEGLSVSAAVACTYFEEKKKAMEF